MQPCLRWSLALLALGAGCREPGGEPLPLEDGCRSCHGSNRSAAPPRALDGTSDPESVGVGAHDAHLFGTRLMRPISCTECHLRPEKVDDPGHLDDGPPQAELTWGPLASARGAEPEWRRDERTCASIYCHGDALPVWTRTDGSQVECSSCHGMPPPEPHPQVDACANCHPTAGPGGTIADPTRHVDGVVDVDEGMLCQSCHGSAESPAPPFDLDGLSSSPAVGAHQAHLAGTGRSLPAPCSECHVAVDPSTVGQPGHYDTPRPAEVVFGALARAHGATPAADGARCTNTYCHGATLLGGTNPNPAWSEGEQRCGACHGMPPPTPAHAGQRPDGCQSCHADSAGADQTIVAPALHADGVVQVGGGGCETCHGSPPVPGRESYPGSAGAHAQHATTLGFECATCHGNNGSGPEHDRGNGIVDRANVNLVFDPEVAFAGGTTMGGASYDPDTKTCAVGCHNPVVGNPPEAPNLSNALAWTDRAPGCRGCHDQVQATSPRNHDIAGLGDAGCLTCHDQSRHTSGAIAIRDPDPSDAFAWSPANRDGLCRTCHDGAGGTAFGERTAPDVSAFWTTSSHGVEGYRCSECHTHHASANGPLFLDASSQTCMRSGCHSELASDFGQVANGPLSHHRIEGGAGVQLACIDCHNPHLARPVPLTTIDPDDRYLPMSIPASARTTKRSAGDYRAFCLRCHDGSPPPGVLGALDIATALAGGSDPSFFRKENESLHRKAHSGFNCQNCHLSHGSPGTPGINRGRLLRSYMTVEEFPYRGEGSCGTAAGGNGFSCH